MRIPVATYRFQVNEEFTLEDVRRRVPYLAGLGISDLYLSPIFEARPGSPHGYDVTDPTRIRAAAGGEDSLRRLSADAQAHGMGIILDIVPNHMAASPLNPWWRDVLAHGRGSDHASFFDIDWDAEGFDGRLRLPILGDTLDRVLERGEIDVDAAASELVYFENRFPLAPGSLDHVELDGPDRQAAIRTVLERQHYELAFWRTASEAMNYRRFFDITDLAGLRAEDPDVFRASHALVRRLAAEGIITGLRIDHIDGLRDPAGYLRSLREWVRGPDGEPVYTVVEKILEHDERVPADWHCEGTTGYEFLNVATGLMIHPAGYERLEQLFLRITGGAPAFGELVRDKKLLVIGRLFGSEVKALGRRLASLAPLGVADAGRAVAEVTASMGVYRTYIRGDEVSRDDRRRLEAALQDAAARNPDLRQAIDALRGIVLERDPDDDEALDWIMRWQQFTGPVMAKGFEDTALYCHNVLLAANEVGSDPIRPAIAAQQLHQQLVLRQQQAPYSLNATATHDTKRGEDTRARIAVLSEVPDEWRRQLRRWIREGDEWKAEIAEDEDTAVPEADVDSLLYQTLVGAWPLHGADESFTARIKEYMTKAVREAKEQTSWRRPDEDYEQALATYIDILMEEVGRTGLAEDIGEFAHRLAPHGVINSLAQLLLKVTAPGAPDIYQGTELWSYTLVDPDNRRDVDYAERERLLDRHRSLLAEPDSGRVRALLEQWQDGAIKLVLTALALHARRRHSHVFRDGVVVPIMASGSRADHVVAFARQRDTDACVVVLPRWSTFLAPAGVLPTGRDIWHDTAIACPADLRGEWRNVLTGEVVDAGDSFDIAALLASVPFAFLERA